MQVSSQKVWRAAFSLKKSEQVLTYRQSKVRIEPFLALNTAAYETFNMKYETQPTGQMARYMRGSSEPIWRETSPLINWATPEHFAGSHIYFRVAAQPRYVMARDKRMYVPRRINAELPIRYPVSLLALSERT